jgi:hypothetical protein
MQASTNTQKPSGKRAWQSIPLTALASFLLPGVLAILLAAGCAQSQGTQQALDQQQQNKELQKEVDKLQKQKQEDLQRQIDELKKQNEQAQQQQPQVVVENNETNTGGNPAPEGVVVTAPNYSSSGGEAANVLSAAKAYYQAAEVGNYNYTYNRLSTSDQSRYTYDQWVSANNALDSAASEFVIYDVSPESGRDYYFVSLTVSPADGSSFDRTTEFTYEPGRGWVHSLTSEEHDMFESNLSASATPTATAEQPSTAAPETCEPSALATRLWEGWAAPSDPFGHPPCQNADGTYRSYIPLGYGITPMQKYLDAAETGDYDTMYNLLAPADQQYYTLDEWRQANEAIGTDQSTYEMAGTLVASDEQGATVGGQAIVKITVPTGETVTKYWWFGPAHEGGPEDGPWVHWLNTEEIDLLDDALASR